MHWLIALRNALVILALSWVGVTLESQDASKSDCADATVCIGASRSAN